MDLITYIAIHRKGSSGPLGVSLPKMLQGIDFDNSI